MSYPHLWIPRAQILEPRDALALPRTGMAGRFRIRGRKADGRERLIADWQPNLILDAGLERLVVGSWLSRCFVGSGTTAPAVGDTALQSFIAGADIAVVFSGTQSSTPYYGYRMTTAAFPARGTNAVIAELGWGLSDGGGSLFSRTLIKDEGGTPQAFTWLADEALTVEHEVRAYPWTTDRVAVSTIAGVSTTCTIRAARVTAGPYWRVATYPYALWTTVTGAGRLPLVSDGNIEAITAGIGGTPESASSVTADAYTAGSHKRTGSATWDGGAANFAGGITALEASFGGGCWKIGFSPPIAKTVGKILTLNLESPTWGRQP